MRIVEDKADRDAILRKLALEKFQIRGKSFEPSPRTGWPRKHQLWPCVRAGAGAVWLLEHGSRKELPESAKRRAFNFLRGHAHEALLTDHPSLVIVYEGVGNEVDEYTGDTAAPFSEIKSTTMSSARMLPIVRAGQLKLIHEGRLARLGDPGFEDVYFRHYFEQCCQNCVAFRVETARLRMFFQNGEYAGRRKKCPDCGGLLGSIQAEGMYKLCPSCGYKSYDVDIRSYLLTFTQAERAFFDKEVFHKRRDQFNLAVKAETSQELLMRAEPSPSWLCKSCTVGKEIKCEFFGGGLA